LRIRIIPAYVGGPECNGVIERFGRTLMEQCNLSPPIREPRRGAVDHQRYRGAEVLQWIADHLSGEMVTIETGAGYTMGLFAALAKHQYCCTSSQSERTRSALTWNELGSPTMNSPF